MKAYDMEHAAEGHVPVVKLDHESSKIMIAESSGMLFPFGEDNTNKKQFFWDTLNDYYLEPNEEIEDYQIRQNSLLMAYKEFRKHIIKNIEEHRDPKILEKWHFMAKYFNQKIGDMHLSERIEILI